MRLIDIKHSINIARKYFGFSSRNSNGIYYIDGIQELKVAFIELKKVGLVTEGNDFIEEILNTSSSFLSSDATTYSVRTKILNNYMFLLERFHTWINDYLPIDDSETTINIKLPDLKSFKDLERVSAELRRALNQVTSEIGGEIKIKQLDYGSSWVIIDVNVVAAVPFIFAVVKGGLYLLKEFHSIRKSAEELKKIKIDNKFEEQFKQAQLQLETLKVKELSLKIDKEYFSDKPSDNERLKRIEDSLINIRSFLEKGGEVYPSLIAQEEIVDEVPDYKSITEIVQGLLEEEKIDVESDNIEDIRDE